MEFTIIKEPLTNVFPTVEQMGFYGMLFELKKDDGTTEYKTLDDCYIKFPAFNSLEELKAKGPGEYLMLIYPSEEECKTNGIHCDYVFIIGGLNSSQGDSQIVPFAVACGTPGNYSATGCSRVSSCCYGFGASTCPSCTTDESATTCTSCPKSGLAACQFCGQSGKLSCDACPRSSYSSCSGCGNSGQVSCVACPTSGLSSTSYDSNFIFDDTNSSGNKVEVEGIDTVIIDGNTKSIGDLVAYSTNNGKATSTAGIISETFTGSNGDVLSWDYVCQAESADKGYVKIYKDNEIIKTFSYNGVSTATWKTETYTLTSSGTYSIRVEFIKNGSVNTLSDKFFFKKFYITFTNGDKRFLSWGGSNIYSYDFNYFIKRV